jgi:GYF domain 2
MYKIIGADQKEYGPITGDQIRQWIAEGRVNAHTQARADGAAEWQPLSAFAEFAEAFGLGTARSTAAPAIAPLQDSGGRAAALQAVKGPAIALKVTAILGLVMVALGLVMNMMSLTGHPLTFGMHQLGDPRMQKMFNQIGGSFGIVQSLIGGGIGVVILMGASKMQSLTSYQFAFTASILAMLPCLSPCCILGFPFGIWALVVLNKPGIKTQFT